MQSTTLKSKMESLIRNLPENASIEDAIERLFLLHKIEKALNKPMPASPFHMNRHGSVYASGSTKVDFTGGRRYRSNMCLH